MRDLSGLCYRFVCGVLYEKQRCDWFEIGHYTSVIYIDLNHQTVSMQSLHGQLGGGETWYLEPRRHNRLDLCGCMAGAASAVCLAIGDHSELTGAVVGPFDICVFHGTSCHRIRVTSSDSGEFIYLLEGSVVLWVYMSLVCFCLNSQVVWVPGLYRISGTELLICFSETSPYAARGIQINNQ